jgi:hypothetical protein
MTAVGRKGFEMKLVVNGADVEVDERHAKTTHATIDFDRTVAN